MTAKKKDENTEVKEENKPDMSLMAQLNSQREVRLKMESDEADRVKPKEADLIEKAKVAGDKAKALENENAQLKLIINDLKSQVRRLGEEVESQKKATKKASAKKGSN